jgi:hypothetical protein
VTLIRRKIARRAVLRGMMQGARVTVGLPLLDCFLDGNGAALADGAPLPVAVGPWFWGCGLNPGRWEPATTGPGYQMAVELQPLARFRDKINVYSGMTAHLDGRPNPPHFMGPAAILNGSVLQNGIVPNVPSIDMLVADAIGGQTRFRSLEVACTGNPANSHSVRAGSVVNPSEISPLALYARVFGPDFKDPNAADFKPDPAIMVRRSVLSAVGEQSRSVLNAVGAADRLRLEEYFTSLRALEQQLDIALQKPAPLEACTVPPPGDRNPVGTVLETALEAHALFAGILAHALACGQTRVFNVAFSEGLSPIRLAGEANTQHLFTHEDPVDERVGYQPNVAKFVAPIMGGFATLLAALDGIREGDRTLLDRTLVFACTDHGFAKIHTLDNIPMMTAGGAAGRLKTGLHFAAAKGDPVTRVGLTLQQALGVSASSWGTQSNNTSKTIAEVMV